ncbi:hypothetical protein PJM29_32000, partial [Mycobacterium kansasii]
NASQRLSLAGVLNGHQFRCRTWALGLGLYAVPAVAERILGGVGSSFSTDRWESRGRVSFPEWALPEGRAPGKGE